MKRIFAVMALAGLMASCNSDASTSEDVKDSVMDVIDSSKEAKIDSIQDSTEAVKERLENTFDKTDSANRAANTMADTTK